MALPKIGETITTERAVELCKYFGLQSLVRRIELNPEAYKDWRFDGVSCVPDQLLGVIMGKDPRKITEQALKHDLWYAYGDLQHESIERWQVDNDLKENLMEFAGLSDDEADIFFWFVQKYGGSKFKKSYSWGFARKEK